MMLYEVVWCYVDVIMMWDDVLDIQHLNLDSHDILQYPNS